MRKMYVDAVVVVGPERATRAAFFPVRTEHEMINQQLFPAGKQIGERYLAVGAFKYVVLVYFDPR